MRSGTWEIGSFDRESALGLYQYGINPLVSVFLAARGITDINDVNMYIGNSSASFFDPFLMSDMDKAVYRIKKAVETGEHIAIYGDYDVDGMTSVVLLSLWLRSKNAKHEIYIPGRLDEGYGLNNKALDTLKSRGVDLVITVDCGVTAIDEALYADMIGLDLVITDHHECREILPSACAVVDPKRNDCAYPNKSLAGVGVAFKLVCALEGEYLSDDIFKLYSELVAIGTVADIMPVTGENRNLIKKGFDILNSNPRPGINRLLQEVNIVPGKVTASTIGFSLAPRLNAAGRMGKADLSVELLLTQSYDKSIELVTELCLLNSQRRIHEQSIYDEAFSMLKEDDLDGPVVLAKYGWHQGVTGIVAAKMSERLKLPVIIISIDDDGIGRGSCRSYGSFSIYNALELCNDILDNFGGHEMAAGVTVPEDKIDELRKRIHEFFYENIDSMPQTGLELDFEVEKPDLLTLANIEALAKLQPFGTGNPSPAMCMTGVMITSLQSIGAGKHSKLKIEKTGKILDCIFFTVPVGDLGVSEGDLVDIAFEPQVNEFRGNYNVQLQLIDIRASITNL